MAKKFRHIFLLPVVSLFFIVPAKAQVHGTKTYCNPVDISYRYQYIHEDRHISYRSAADPVIFNYKGEYYLFATNSGGWWQSDDLGHWKYIKPDLWAKEHVNAPAVKVIRDTVFMYPSGQAPLFYSTDLTDGHLRYYNRMMPKVPGKAPLVDPDIFYDKPSDTWIMYYGSSNFYPIYGIKLDHSKKLAYEGNPIPLLRLHPDKHGWERFGKDHTDTSITPFIEGAYMTKHDGKYYLQYAAPGTEYNVYANGTYVSDHPLGPFRYASNNPVSYKPGGFTKGAGHGNTFKDEYGNFWNTGACWIGYNWNFERRIVMFPAGFDKGGHLYSDTRFGDFPHYLPTGKWKNRKDLFTGWMLLSYEKPVTASSVRDTFRTANLTDENMRSFWVAGSNHKGEWAAIDLKEQDTVKAVQVNFADYKSDIYHSTSSVYTQFRIFASKDDKTWALVADRSHQKNDRADEYIQLQKPVVARYVKYENVHVSTPNLAVSAIRVFGNGPGPDPQTPAAFSVIRDKDPRNARVSWKKVPGAVGYNILWGIGKNELYETYQLFADKGNSKEISSLDTGQDYYFAIEAFNENGVSKRSRVIHIK